MRLGFDFDNTIIRYDHVFFNEVLKRNWIQSDSPLSKHQIRERLRQQAGGETRWRALQAFVYGEGIMQGQISQGLKDCLSQRKNLGDELFIISHKTPYPTGHTSGIHLHQSAMQWINHHELLEYIPEEHIFFETTRLEKVQRIELCQCDYFIDDLIETFNEEAFPNQTQKILFDPSQDHLKSSLERVRSFEEYTQYLNEP